MYFQSSFVMLLVFLHHFALLWVKCVSTLMHGKTRAMAFLGFDPLYLLPVTFLSLEVRLFLETDLLTCTSQERPLF